MNWVDFLMFAQQMNCRFGAEHKQLYPAFLQYYISYDSRITPCPWLSPCSFSSSFLLSQTYPWRKQKTQSGKCRDPSVQGISIIWESRDQGCSNISSMSCVPGGPLDPKTWWPQLSHCRMSHPCPGCGSRGYRGMLLSPHDKENTDFSGSLSPVHGLYFSLK